MKKSTMLVTRLILALALVVIAVPAVTAQSDESKIVILIKDIETPSTRAAMGKYMDVKREEVPYQGSAITDADRASLDPEFLGAIRQNEVIDNISQQKAERDEIERRNRKREVVADQLRDQFVGTDAGRNIIQAKDWLVEALSDYSEFIQVVDRSEQDSTMTETALNAANQTARGGVTHIMRIIVGDVKERTTKTTAYGTTTVQLQKSLNVSVAINDLNDRSVFTKSFDGKVSRVQTSYGNTVVDDDHEELLRSALAQAGDAIGKKFTAEVTVTLRPPRGEEDTFDPGSVSIVLDGQYISDGEAVRTIVGQHELTIESDEYSMSPNPRKFTVNSDQKIPVTLQSAYGVVSFSVPGNLDVDINSIMVELVDQDENAETLYGEGPHRLRKGNYSLKVDADGFMPFEMKRLAVSGGTEDKPAKVNLALKANVDNQQN